MLTSGIMVLFSRSDKVLSERPRRRALLDKRQGFFFLYDSYLQKNCSENLCEKLLRSYPKYSSAIIDAIYCSSTSYTLFFEINLRDDQYLGNSEIIRKSISGIFFTGQLVGRAVTHLFLGAGYLRFKSRAFQIGHTVANGFPPLRHFFERNCVVRVQ